MKTQFEIKAWLSENREVVISKYNDLTNEKFYNGISLNNFMVEVLNAMVRNNVKSEKRASSMLPFLMGDIYFNNSNINSVDKKTNELKEKYNGTSYMAMV